MVGILKGLGGFLLRRFVGRDFGDWIEYVFVEVLREFVLCWYKFEGIIEYFLVLSIFRLGFGKVLFVGVL